VVIASIGALSDFGIISPSRFLPEKCILSPGFACEDMTVTSMGITFLVKNAAGIDATNFAVESVAEFCPDIASGPVTLRDGQSAQYTINCVPPKGRFQGDLYVTYTNPIYGLLHNNTGSFIIKVDSLPGGVSQPQNETPVSSGGLYGKPGHTFKGDQTSKITAVDGNEKHTKKDEAVMHVVFDQALTNGNVIHMYISACHQNGLIQVLEEGIGNSVGSGSCIQNTNMWVNITLTGVTTPSTTWDLTSEDSDVDYNYIGYN